MTDKQEPDIVERLRKYPADPTMCDDYSAAMLDAADEIERLREQMSMMAQYGKPPAQPADIGNTISSKTPEPNEENPYVLWREIHRLRTEVQGPSGFATWQDAAVAERVRRVKAEQELRAAQPAPAQEPQLVSNTDELPQRLSDERIMHFWDIHAGMPTEKYPLNYKDVRAFARAIEAAIVPPGYVVVPVEPTPEIITDGVRALYDASWGDFDAEREEMIATYRAMIAAAPKGQS